MRIGYACINLSLACRSSRTFRLKSYSAENMERTVGGNLSCLMEQLRFNLRHGILYFRISSDLVPFASHPVCDYPWQKVFRREFEELGRFVIEHGMRVTMHPDQFILINSPDADIHARSVAELAYHAEVLDLMGLAASHKIQLHVGGVYGDRRSSLERFARRYRALPAEIRRRLAVENDERSYGLADCMEVHERTGIPVVFDALHHAAHNRGEGLREAVSAAGSTWEEKDGPPMVDYSSQKKGGRPGAHADSLDEGDFRSFLEETRGLDFDLMLEVKDKERSALEAIAIAREYGIV
ncbi:MAG: UV DNA damage repair endonuclease UvsE [Actinobacteria bacterium]|nr:UV DNA damage repair endonuclease UvsE [Actinomycetota bacterium]MDI6831458.1 UV DNA damage repair endonuclease UvsE [Actinomycetota bacterium]